MAALARLNKVGATTLSNFAKPTPESFPASNLWAEKPCLVLAVRRPG
jgi:hypothetical protein